MESKYISEEEINTIKQKIAQADQEHLI